MLGRHTTRVNPVYGRFRDGVRVFAHVILDAVLFFADLVGPDGASVLETDDVSSRRQGRQKN